MTQALNLAAIRSVELAAANLRLACTEIVGPTPMAVAMPLATMLAQGLPRRLERDVQRIERRERKT